MNRVSDDDRSTLSSSQATVSQDRAFEIVGTKQLMAALLEEVSLAISSGTLQSSQTKLLL